MPRFAANLSMMFTEWDFLDRFAAAADAGFDAVEFLFPYDYSPDAIGERLQRHGLTQALFNLPPGEWHQGERGFAALPERFEDFRRSVEIALPYATATGVKRLHMLSGKADSRDPKAIQAFRRAVSWCAEIFSRQGLDVMIEPINSRDVPGYFLNNFEIALGFIDEMKLPNLKMQFDIYHRQIIHGDVTFALRDMMSSIGHIQIASVPSRHEPLGEELNYPFLFEELDRLGYSGFVGCEYRPRTTTMGGIGWFKPYARREATK